MQTWILMLNGSSKLKWGHLGDPEYEYIYRLFFCCCGNEHKISQNGNFTKWKISHVELEVPWKHIVLGIQFKKYWADRKGTHFLLTEYTKKVFHIFTFISPVLVCSI